MLLLGAYIWALGQYGINTLKVLLQAPPQATPLVNVTPQDSPKINDTKISWTRPQALHTARVSQFL